MKNVVSKLFQLRKALDECEKEFGLNNYSEVERAVFSFVTANTNSTITSIKNEPYFSKYSLSIFIVIVPSRGVSSASVCQFLLQQLHLYHHEKGKKHLMP